jgi:hypothetical protein
MSEKRIFASLNIYREVRITKTIKRVSYVIMAATLKQSVIMIFDAPVKRCTGEFRGI